MDNRYIVILQERNEEIQKEYGFCTIDGHTEKIGNFRIEPPGLFRGRGEHPKQASTTGTPDCQIIWISEYKVILLRSILWWRLKLILQLKFILNRH